MKNSKNSEKRLECKYKHSPWLPACPLKLVCVLFEESLNRTVLLYLSSGAASLATQCPDGINLSVLEMRQGTSVCFYLNLRQENERMKVGENVPLSFRHFGRIISLWWRVLAVQCPSDLHFFLSCLCVFHFTSSSPHPSLTLSFPSRLASASLPPSLFLSVSLIAGLWLKPVCYWWLALSFWPLL